MVTLSSIGITDIRGRRGSFARNERWKVARQVEFDPTTHSLAASPSALTPRGAQCSARWHAYYAWPCRPLALPDDEVHMGAVTPRVPCVAPAGLCPCPRSTSSAASTSGAGGPPSGTVARTSTALSRTAASPRQRSDQDACPDPRAGLEDRRAQSRGSRQFRDRGAGACQRTRLNTAPGLGPALGDRRDPGDGQVGWVVAAHKHAKTTLRTRSDKPASAQI